MLGKLAIVRLDVHCESSHATVRAESACGKPDHASAIGMGSRIIAPFGHDKRNWGWALRLDTMGVVEGKPFHRSHFDQATKNGALSLAKETGRRSLGCI